MQPAAPNWLVMHWFDGWCRRALTKHFHRVQLHLESIVQWDRFDPSVPRIYVANHSSFWDGIILNFLLRKFRRGQPLYCMIDEVQVKEHLFFPKIGGFSISRSDGRDAIASIAYASELLHRSTNPPAIVMFPQGKIEPNDIRPLRIEAATTRIIERCPQARVVPVALKYEFWMEQRPELLVRIGSEMHSESASNSEIARTLQAKLTELLDFLKQAGLEQRAGDRIVLEGRRSISKWKRIIGGGKV